MIEKMTKLFKPFVSIYIQRAILRGLYNKCHHHKISISFHISDIHHHIHCIYELLVEQYRTTSIMFGMWCALLHLISFMGTFFAPDENPHTKWCSRFFATRAKHTHAFRIHSTRRFVERDIFLDGRWMAHCVFLLRGRITMIYTLV